MMIRITVCMCECSFWAEATAGEFCQRLTQNRKNVGYSLMADYRERAYVSLMRTLHPEILATNRKSHRYRVAFEDHPDYLSAHAVVRLADTMITSNRFTVPEKKMFIGFLENNAQDMGMEVPLDGRDNIRADAVMDEVVCYKRAVLNGVPISTIAAEEDKVTCDSVVCGRYTIEDDDTEVFFIGQVQHIASYLGHILLCVEWFQVDALDDDQRVGLTIIPVTIMNTQDEMWIDAGSIVIQKHVVVRPNLGSRSFHVAIKP